MTNINDKKEPLLTKKEMKSTFYQSMFLQLGWNYQNMQGLGYCATMEKVIEKNYTTKEEKIKALEIYMDYFNTNPYVSQVVFGANIALEEQEPGDLESVRALKLSLMGPLAGIGDTIIIAIYSTIVLAITATFAMSGNAFAWIAAFFPFVFYSIPIFILRIKLYKLGYEYGTDIFVKYQQEFELIKKYGYIFGIIVIGALGASVLKVNLPEFIMVGEVEIKLNSVINSLLPGILTLLTILGAYWSLGLKKMNSTRLLFSILIIGICLGATGILV